MSLKSKDINNESVQELERRVQDMREKYMNLRFNHASGTLKNPLELRSIRKDIARCLTIISEKKNERKDI
ncbi:50S ribosomal protein L29 [Elusimicrobiota bacterium]